MAKRAAGKSAPTGGSGVNALQCAWQPGAPDGNLSPGDIHLWALELDFMARAQRLLGAAEAAAAQRRRMPAARARYVGGRIGLRLLLCAYTGLANHALRFGFGGRGKPLLLNRLRGGELCFNYAVSGNQALYAMAWNRRVGVDLEILPRKINAARLARRKLAAIEQRAWRAVPAPWREQAMLACWTRKEAYGKALGVGIRYRLNQVPLFVDRHAPRWRCRVSGLFDAHAATPPELPAMPPEPHATPTPPAARILHGIQFAPPFPGLAALMYDGDALPTPTAATATAPTLSTWRWTPTPAEVDSLFAAPARHHEP